MELIPAPFAHLVRRMFREYEREQKVFDLSARKFWHGSADVDTRVTFHGRPAGNPVGPAAGPQDQMAQNLVLAWLSGSRILELKTVQINDRLVLPRPCIDAVNVGYNVEWSQELRLQDSLREYVKGSMLVDMLRATNLLGRESDRDRADTIFDLSVGYDLKGISTPQIRGWIEGMKDASKMVEELRREIPEDFKHLREIDYRTKLSDQLTLSTFHGCPASEIEGIVRFLLAEMDLQVVVKLNPTLLGRQAVDGLLHDVMGYHEIETRPHDFEADLQWEQALEITDRLGELARSLGRTLGVKFSNTLVVKNHRTFFTAAESVQYMSGQPLHVITMNLVDKWRKARPEVPISFSAGVDNQNFADCVAAGFTPVTTCTDLLRPGGYGRLPKYVENLEEKMRAKGAKTVADFVLRAYGHGEAALGQACPQALAAYGRGESVAAVPGIARAVTAAAVLNTPEIVAKVTAEPRYRAEKMRGVPKKIGTKLWLFDCISCDKCVPVCPNDANFVYETKPLQVEYHAYVVKEGALATEKAGLFAVKKPHQIANFQDFCNECGNCDTFCPEDLGPYIEKPRFFGSAAAFEEYHQRDGFLVERRDGTDAARLRHHGREYRLTVDRAKDEGVFTDGVVEVTVRHGERRPLAARLLAAASDGHRLEFSAYLNLALALDGVLDTRKANPVNAAYL